MQYCSRRGVRPVRRSVGHISNTTSSTSALRRCSSSSLSCYHLLLILQSDLQPIQRQPIKSRDFYTAMMMSAGRIFRTPSVVGSVSKRCMSNVEIVNNKIVLAKLRQVPGKKIIYFVSIKSPICANIYQII